MTTIDKEVLVDTLAAVESGELDPTTARDVASLVVLSAILDVLREIRDSLGEGNDDE